MPSRAGRSRAIGVSGQLALGEPCPPLPRRLLSDGERRDLDILDGAPALARLDALRPLRPSIRRRQGIRLRHLRPGPVEGCEDPVGGAVGLGDAAGVVEVWAAQRREWAAIGYRAVARSAVGPGVTGREDLRVVLHSQRRDDVRRVSGVDREAGPPTVADRAVQRPQRGRQVAATPGSGAVPQHGVDDEQRQRRTGVQRGDQRGVVCQAQVASEPQEVRHRSNLARRRLRRITTRVHGGR